MADITLVEGDLTDIVYVDLFDDDGLPVTPATSCTFELRVDAITLSVACDLEGANRVSFAPTVAMVAVPGTFRGRFYVDSTTYYPSTRSPYSVLIRPHTRTR